MSRNIPYIAQFNHGRMKWPLEDPRMAEFAAALAEVYAEAEAHSGFVWRIADDDMAADLAAAGHDERTSATVSVWRDQAALYDFTYSGDHGRYLERAGQWFEKIDGPQLVIWPVAESARPSGSEALARMADLAATGPSARAFGWRGPPER